MRKCLFLTLFSLLVASSALMARATTRLVPQQYSTIQAAVDAAHSGDTVKVSAGIYNENVVISTNGIVLKSNSGAILDGTGTAGANGVLINATGVTVTGLTVQNYTFGISTFTGGNSITYNTLTNNTLVGIDISTGTNENSNVPAPQPTYINHNSITGSGLAGIFLDFSQNVVVSQNSVDYNVFGIYISDGSINCTVTMNEASHNQFYGILIDFGHTNLILLNIALYNGEFDLIDSYGGNLWLLNIYQTSSGI